MDSDIDFNAVKLLNQRGLQHVCRRSSGEDPPSVEQNQVATQSGCQIEIVRRDDDGEIAALVQLPENCSYFKLIREIERRRRFVE